MEQIGKAVTDSTRHSSESMQAYISNLSSLMTAIKKAKQSPEISSLYTEEILAISERAADSEADYFGTEPVHPLTLIDEAELLGSADYVFSSLAELEAIEPGILF